MNKLTAVFLTIFAFLLGGITGIWGVSKFWGRFNLDSSINSKSADVGFTTRTLELVRGGNTTGAVELLELRLDGSVSVLGRVMSAVPASQWDSADIRILQLAKEYRTRFPRANEVPQIQEGVEKAFRLINDRKSQ